MTMMTIPRLQSVYPCEVLVGVLRKKQFLSTRNIQHSQYPCCFFKAPRYQTRKEIPYLVQVMMGSRNKVRHSRDTIRLVYSRETS